MMVKKSLCLVAAFSFLVVGCKWNDDFRSRLHPQYEEPKPEATFNEDSDAYVGDNIAKGQRKGEPELEAIDGLSDIPELPESPNPMN